MYGTRRGSGAPLEGVHGVLTGIIPAFVAWVLRSFPIDHRPDGPLLRGRRARGRDRRRNGGFLAFKDPSVVQSANSVTLVTALLVVMLVSFYAHNLGDQLGATLPNRRAVSVAGLVSTGLARGDEVTVLTGETAVPGRVVSARSAGRDAACAGRRRRRK